MRFSTLVGLSTILAGALSHPVNHHHKRALVTDVIHMTEYFYKDALVYVDQNGVAFSTDVQVVSTAVVTGSGDVQAAVQTAAAVQPTTTTEITTSSIVATTTTTPPAPAPTTSSSSSSSAAPAPAPTTSNSPVAAVAAAPATSSPAAAAPSASSSSSSSSGTFSGQATFYSPGLGACGETNTDSDMICALNYVQFDAVNTPNPNNNPDCNRKINVFYQGKTITVTMVDRCPGCQDGDLDLSPTAFSQLADESVGRIDITWDWAS